jgi:predicted NBD/HSP70 family sugar kinase
MQPRPRETKLAAKKNRILNEVFRSRFCSRIDLARRLNINNSMVGSYVDEFLSAGLLVEDEPVNGARGRTPVPLRPNARHGCFLGLDFEALRARAVLSDFAGEMLDQREISFRSDVTREGVLKQIVSLARRLSKKADRPLLSVGIAAPGLVDCVSGRVVRYPLIPDFDQVPVHDRFAAEFDVPVFVEDNNRAVAFGELLRGAGRGCTNFLCLAIRSGVALGIVIDGKLYYGTHAMAGELGDTVFPTQHGPRTVRELVSAKGFVNTTRRLIQSRTNSPARESLLKKGDDLTLAEIVSAAEKGDDFLREQLEQLGRNLGMIVANLATLFAPEKIVLGGEVPNCSFIVRQTMERAFRQYALPQVLKTAYIEDGELGGFAGALGVAWMGFGRLYPQDEDVLVRMATQDATIAG